MSTLQPFIWPADVFAYLFNTRLNSNEEFSLLEADIKKELDKVFMGNPEAEDELIIKAFSLIFSKENLDPFAKMVCLIMKYKRLGTTLLNYFDDLEKAKDALEKEYEGDFANKSDFAYRYVERFEPLPEKLEAYIDYERLTHDLFINEFYAIEVGDRTHVFKRES